ncbi:hypothetical protein L3X38_002168 [Prunus dulcis]|uniref:Uncharacterized protein n=1 Tax=Prunus dulcis TaxID=3755 RepID=A0AAD4ZKV8_PRUDU|nr:hypothetical protein L3X38_002168 [Prunus dulcis]
MTFTNMLKALGLLNNGPAPGQCYNPDSTRGTTAPATSKGYNHPGYSPPPPLPNVVNGYPVNNNYTPNPAPNAYYYYYPTQPAPTNPLELSHDNVTSFVPHGHDISEGLKPPNAYGNSSSIAGPDQPANSKSRISTCANPQLPKNIGKVDKHKNIGEKKGKKRMGKKRVPDQAAIHSRFMGILLMEAKATRLEFSTLVTSIVEAARRETKKKKIRLKKKLTFVLKTKEILLCGHNYYIYDGNSK